MWPIILVVFGMLCIVSSFGFEGDYNTLFCVLGIVLIGAAIIMIIVNLPVNKQKNVYDQQTITHFGGIPLERFQHNDQNK